MNLIEINSILKNTYNLANKKKIFIDKNSIIPENLKIGLDLGTALIKFLILNQNNLPVLCFLEWANVVRDGIVSDYWGAVQITKRMASAAMDILEIENLPPVSAGYPPKTDPRLVENVIYSAGLEVKKMIDEPTAAAKFLNIKSGAVVDIGGGTTGIAIIKNNKVIDSFDEATGGHHWTLVISGNKKIDYEKAELLKRADIDGKYFSILKPVMEKMASIVKIHTAKFRNLKTIFLVGGPTSYKNFSEVFRVELNKEIISFEHPELITPFGITI